MKCSVTIRLSALLSLLVLFVIVACYAYARELYEVMGLFAVASCYVVGRIVYWQRSTTRMFIRLLDDVKYHDNTLHFSTQHFSGIEREMVEKMNDLLDEIKKNHLTKAEQSDYYETLLNIIDSCLIVVNQDDQIYWMNLQAELQLCGYAVHSIDELGEVHQDLPHLIRTIRPGEIKSLRIYRKEVAIDMAITVTVYQKRGQHYKLVHLRNIRSLLEKNEMEAWQKLVRVLTHEIMNSIAPIISLSDTFSEYTADKEWMEDNAPLLRQGLQTIHRRSQGLLDFVENYRKLTRISTPVLAPVKVGDLLHDIQKLCHDYPLDLDIENEDLEVMMDRPQMEQVLLNLLKNAYEACSDRPHPCIRLRSYYMEEQHLWTLKISDNGCGILPDVVDKIFVPFFTTKTSGSGIGLSLCKQVVNLHGGRIAVQSEEDKGTTFTIKMIV